MTKVVEGMKPLKVIKDPENRTICYTYNVPTTPESDSEVQVLLCGCLCPIPKDEYPFHNDVFKYLENIASWIKIYSDKYDVPPIAVAGAIADEYNSRFFDWNRLKSHSFNESYQYIAHFSLKKVGDHTQDKIIPETLKINERTPPKAGYPGIVPPYYIIEEDDSELNERIEQGYRELIKLDPKNENRPTSKQAINYKSEDFKFSFAEIKKNFTIWSDYGTANISLRTAIDLYKEYRHTFSSEHKNLSHAQLLRYLVSDQGTVQFTALSILNAKKNMSKLLPSLPPRKQEAVLVTFFKQGAKYKNKYERNNLDKPSAKIKAGEGCRTCYQRSRIASSIGVIVKDLE